ncbi:ribosome small subunit-dependent GTPase A [bacterium]|nr:ribosome small subunit-dependent GTPase A [bacterium]
MDNAGQIGLVIRVDGNRTRVRSSEGIVVDCFLPKTLRRAARQRGTTVIAVGDRVEWTLTDSGSGKILKILPREHVFSRSNPTDRRPGEDVLVTNPGRLLVIDSLADPTFNPRLVDRILCAAEAQDIPASIICNKSDLVAEDTIPPLLERYQSTGYETLVTSVISGRGLDELSGWLDTGITLLSGRSGVGKSSLLNALAPGLGRRVAEISAATNKGRHTTTATELLPYKDGFVIDTPGIREFGLWRITKGRLGRLFPEFAPYQDHCHFRDCLHNSEPRCAVKTALAKDKINQKRYESYLAILTNLPKTLPYLG